MFSSKYRMHALLVLVALVIVFFPLLNQRPPKEKAAAATAAATLFLQQVDADRFVESWQLTAPATQEKIAQPDWVAQLEKLRALTGPLVQRSENKVVLSTPAEFSPEGDYIVITYDSTFRRKADASEIVTVMQEKDGDWRVAGYYIK